MIQPFGRTLEEVNVIVGSVIARLAVYRYPLYTSRPGHSESVILSLTEVVRNRDARMPRKSSGFSHVLPPGNTGEVPMIQ